MTNPDTPTIITLRGCDGIRLEADAYGDPSAQPVLLLHGGGQTRQSWGNTGASLAGAGFYAICIDARGHGGSAWDDDGDYTLDAFRDDLAAVVSSFDTAPALIGASLGGLTSLLVIAERPELEVCALIMVDIATRAQPSGVQRIIDFMTARPDGFASLEEVADAIAAYLPHRERRTNLEGLKRVVRLGEDGRWHWHWDPRFIQRKWTADYSQRRDTDTRDRLDGAARQLTLPTLLVRGRMSDVISEEDVAIFQQLAPHSEFVDVKRAGHMAREQTRDPGYWSGRAEEQTRGLGLLPGEAEEQTSGPV